ncbi:hypothetical protein [Nitrosococcus wardiae]|uniref:SPOR domain-containing protein n=1 Tax=Nitrosococcus wardiae TaxID=1814290 RepID=A0A4P7BZI4_9GAMM|nr:hypothetical protein [Nitrosococcus wardiae]QBQ55643.1 hypothetical protein E3U44_14835 [Nitrosococcus wardiae]
MDENKKAEELISTTDELAAKTATLDEQSRSLKATTQELTRRTEELNTKIGELTQKSDSAESLLGALKGRSDTLETSTRQLASETQELQTKTGDLATKVEEALGAATTLERKVSGLTTSKDELAVQLDALKADSDELNTRTTKLENKSANQASQLRALGARTDKHISRSHKFFWVLGIAVALWPVAGVWLHLNHTKKLAAQVPMEGPASATLIGQLNEADQAQNELQAQIAQTQPQDAQTSGELEAVQETLIQHNRLWSDLKQKTVGLNASMGQLEQRVSALEQKSLLREEISRLGPSLHNANWLLGQPPEHYTLQLLTAINEAWLADFIERYPPPPNSVHFHTAEGGWYRHRVVTGVYENIASASQALQALPDPWKKYNPWIRRIGPIQQNISARPGE